MSWLNANDYFVMDAMAAARLEDLRSTTEALPASAHTPPAVADADRARCHVITCGVRSTLRALDELRAAR
jgi:hypothetical protein